jgi:excisionase family DNA binding protein
MNAAQPSEAGHPAPFLLSPVEAALALGICRTTLYGLMMKGRLPSIRIGRARRIRRADVERLSETGTSLENPSPPHRRHISANQGTGIGPAERLALCPSHPSKPEM